MKKEEWVGMCNPMNQTFHRKNTTKFLVVFFVVKPNKYVDNNNIQMYNDNIKGGKYYEEGF